MKKYFLLLFALLTTIAFAQQTGIKISALPLNATPATVGANDSFPYVNVGANATNRLKISDLPGTPGFLSYNAPTASALASIPSQCGAGQFATGVAANGNANCAAGGGLGTVTSVGLSAPTDFTVTGSPVTGAGTLAFSWANPVAISHGGTGQSTKTTAFNALSPDITTGDINYFDGTNNVALPIGTTGQVLTVAGGLPSWAAGGGSGTVTTVSVASANGFAGTVANATTTPAITLSTSVTGLLKGNGTAISAASAGTDYQAPVSIGLLDAQAVNANGLAFVSNVLSSQSADATHPGMVNTTTQTFAGNKTFSGTVGASNLSGTNNGDVTLTAVGAAPSANGASLSGQALTLQPFDGTNPGVVTASGGGTTNFLRADGTWAAPPGGGGSGTVTSVALTAPSILSVAGSPVTTSGTLALTLATESANTVFAGPTTGAATSPTFRSLVAADIPALSYSSSTLTSAHLFVGNVSNVATDTAITGDVTITNAGVTAVGANKVANSQLAQMAAHTFKGNNTGSTANAIDLTDTQATAELNAMVGDSGAGGTKGLVPAPAAGDAAAGKFLKADGTFAVPPGSGGSSPYSVTAVKTSAYTAAASDFIPADASGGAFSIASFAASGNASKTFCVKKTDSTGNAVTVTFADLVDGDASFVITAPGVFCFIVNNGGTSFYAY